MSHLTVMEFSAGVFIGNGFLTWNFPLVFLYVMVLSF